MWDDSERGDFFDDDWDYKGEADGDQQQCNASNQQSNSNASALNQVAAELGAIGLGIGDAFTFGYFRKRSHRSLTAMEMFMPRKLN